VADVALSGELRARVIGVDRAGIVRIVASIAFRRRPLGTVRVAEVTADVSVCASQRKCRAIMIEICRFPRHGAVTRGAVMVEPREQVIRIGRTIVVALVASETLHCGSGVTPTVARLAGNREMRTGQRESRQIMVVLRRLPRIRSMAPRTVMVEAAQHVIGICCVRVLIFMTSETCTGSPGVGGRVA